MARRERFIPPDTPDLADALRRVYDDLNKIAQMVPGDAPAQSPRRRAGEQRIEKRGDRHYLVVRTDEGERFIPTTDPPD